MHYSYSSNHPLENQCQAVRIVANTEGLIALAIVLFEAVSVVEKGSTELFCTDAEAYEIQVVRDDSDKAWESLELPYIALKSREDQWKLLILPHIGLNTVL